MQGKSLTSGWTHKGMKGFLYFFAEVTWRLKITWEARMFSTQAYWNDTWQVGLAEVSLWVRISLTFLLLFGIRGGCRARLGEVVNSQIRTSSLWSSLFYISDVFNM